MSLRRRRHSAKYKAHLQSPKWARIRREALERGGHRCAFCSATDRPLHVHHNTYVNLGDEQPEDLVVLCGGRGGCHQVADRMRRARAKRWRPRPRRWFPRRPMRVVAVVLVGGFVGYGAMPLDAKRFIAGCNRGNPSSAICQKR
jgi:5-methylcytosine-specific restriction endonuclease McrA